MATQDTIHAPERSKKLHIAILGPIAGSDIQPYLEHSSGNASPGYPGAPLTGILIGELLKLGHRVTAITTDSTLPLDCEPMIATGRDFRYIACPARKKAWRNNGRYLGRIVDLFSFERRALRQIIENESIDIIHAHWTYEFALAALAQRVPHLITCHDSPWAVLRLTKSPYRALRLLMSLQVFRRGGNFSVVSKYLEEELRERLPNIPSIIPNPVAPYVEQFTRCRQLPESRKIAMISNSWDKIKNAERAIIAFNAYKRKEPSAELYLYGNGYGRNEIASQWTAERKIDTGIHFCGRVPHRDLIRQLATMDCLLHPSLEESFGVVIAEAMALGLPVIGGKTSGAVPWVIGEDDSMGTSSGILINVRDTGEITKALHKLFDEAYPQRSMHAQKRAANFFSASAIASSYEAEYIKILNSSRKLAN